MFSQQKGNDVPLLFFSAADHFDLTRGWFLTSKQRDEMTDFRDIQGSTCVLALLTVGAVASGLHLCVGVLLLGRLTRGAPRTPPLLTC